jgi:hypothetical protein
MNINKIKLSQNLIRYPDFRERYEY